MYQGKKYAFYKLVVTRETTLQKSNIFFLLCRDLCYMEFSRKLHSNVVIQEKIKTGGSLMMSNTGIFVMLIAII